MSELNYKASNIAKAEREHNTNFLLALRSLSSVPSISEVLFLLEAGGMSEDEASDFFDKNGITKTLDVTAETLTTSGFLASTPEVQQAVAKAKASLGTSQSTGVIAKAQPSK